MAKTKNIYDRFMEITRMPYSNIFECRNKLAMLRDYLVLPESTLRCLANSEMHFLYHQMKKYQDEIDNLDNSKTHTLKAWISKKINL